MPCPTVSALVTSGICERCECHGSCKIEAIVLSQLKDGMKLVTIKDALDIYKRKYRADEGIKKKKVSIIRRDVEMIGISLDLPLCDMTEDKFDRLVEAMRKDGATKNGTAFRDETIKGHFAAWRLLDGDTMRKFYRKEGYDLMSPIEIDKEKYDLKDNEVQQISIVQITRLAEEMVLLKRGDRNQRNVFLFLFMALYVGLSKIDILSAKWDNFKDTPNGKFYVAKRHKTNRDICVRIPAQVWAMLDGFEKPSGEFVIVPDKRGQKGKRSGDKVARRAGEVCKSCTIGGEYAGQKTVHALRKYKAQLERVIHGVEESARVMAHTVSVNNRSYSTEASKYTLVAVA